MANGKLAHDDVYTVSGADTDNYLYLCFRRVETPVEFATEYQAAGLYPSTRIKFGVDWKISTDESAQIGVYQHHQADEQSTYIPANGDPETVSGPHNDWTDIDEPPTGAPSKPLDWPPGTASTWDRVRISPLEIKFQATDTDSGGQDCEVYGFHIETIYEANPGNDGEPTDRGTNRIYDDQQLFSSWHAKYVLCDTMNAFLHAARAVWSVPL